MYVRCDQQELYTRHNLMQLATPLFLVIYHVSLKREWLEHCVVGICDTVHSVYHVSLLQNCSI